jgi:hypothetical protein
MNPVPLSHSQTHIRLGNALGLLDAGHIMFMLFDDQVIDEILNQYDNQKKTIKNPYRWVYNACVQHCKDKSITLEWKINYTLRERYGVSKYPKDEDLYVKQKTEDSSNGELRSQEQEKKEQEAKDAYRLKCEKRSLEYMQRPGSKEKAASYGKYGFLADMKPTESHNLSYSDMSESYITMQMVKFAESYVPPVDIIPQETCTPRSVVENISTFSDGQPMIPDYQAIFDSLDEVDDSQLQPTTVTFDENVSSNKQTVGTLLRRTGLFK